MSKSHGRSHVLIAGGGIAGLEAMLALSELAEGLVDVELLSPGREFVYRPLLVAEPFGATDALRLDLGQVAGDAGARHTVGALESVDPGRRRAATASGETIAYDFLLVAVGASPVEAVPGSLTFSGDEERHAFGDVLAAFGRRGAERIAFVVPREVSWSIAAYELALLTAAERDARRLQGTDIVLVTHEGTPLEVFGPAVSQLVAARLEEAGVSLRTASSADRVIDGSLRLESGEQLEAAAVVALPGLHVPRIAGLPQRDGGFIQTDVRMLVEGLESVWAAGDSTWFPVKQGGLAAQQSDAAARSIAVAAGARVPVEPFEPVLRAALITGRAPQFLRSHLPHRGEGDAMASRRPWWPPTKVAGKYLGPYLSRMGGEDPGVKELEDLSPAPDRGAGSAEHELAIALVLSAADADAAMGEFENALRWLAFVEQLDFVVPAPYVARRFEWRRELEPGLAPDAAAARIDPAFESADAAMTDLYRRIGWFREFEHRTEGDMQGRLSNFDAGLEELNALVKRAGILDASGGYSRQ